jgi:hypothetical protein
LRRASIGLVAVVLVASVVVACNFHVAGIQIPLSTDLGNEDLREVEAGPPDLSQCTTNGAGVGCDGQVLLVCMNGKATPGPSCTDGCSTKGGAHCASLDPGGAAQPSDYLVSGLEPVSLSSTVVFNTDTGAITASPAGRGAGMGVDGATGIYYRLATQSDGSTIGIFSFQSFTLAVNAELQVVGNSPLVILASGDIDIEGGIDVSGTCMPGTTVAGGGLGGAAGMPGANPGKGTMGGGGAGGSPVGGFGGGGGGGYGDVGGAGGPSSVAATSGGAAGKLFGDLTAVDFILSGGGGGGGGGGLVVGTSSVGGSGGGAIQIASNGMITLGAGALLNAGGCHGSGGTAAGGGGGGAGGTILIEGRTITLDKDTVLAANGGGGGGGDGSDGNDGMADDKKPNGGSSSGSGSNGGNGAAKNTTGGSDVNESGGDIYGGGGGGSVGRIALKTKLGTVAGNNATFSPQVGAASPGSVSPSTEGTANFE